MSAFSIKNPVGRWGNEERARLFKAVELYGLNDWQNVQKYVATRNMK